jgi:hypothetical protein
MNTDKRGSESNESRFVLSAFIRVHLWPKLPCNAKRPVPPRRESRTGQPVGSYLDSQVQCAAVSIHQQEGGLFRATDGVLEIGGVRYRFTIYLLNNIAAA